MKLKLALDTSATDLRPVHGHLRNILASTPDWEVVGTVVFEGRVDFLVLVERKYFHQVNEKVFS